MYCPKEIAVFAIGVVTSYTLCVFLGHFCTRVFAPSQNFVWPLLLTIRHRDHRDPSDLGEIRLYRSTFTVVAIRFCVRVDHRRPVENDVDRLME